MVVSNKLHGTKREGQYNLNYSRFDGVGEERREEASQEGGKKSAIAGHVPPELKEALRLIKSGDPTAKKRANELALLAVEVISSIHWPSGWSSLRRAAIASASLCRYTMARDFSKQGR
ncbi:hypothetical protein FOZ62_024611 [Perkinsus olseni]|nr:hypothetical protein FOZ62_024611 [Perkinsus olseni]